MSVLPRLQTDVPDQMYRSLRDERCWRAFLAYIDTHQTFRVLRLLRDAEDGHVEVTLFGLDRLVVEPSGRIAYFVFDAQRTGGAPGAWTPMAGGPGRIFEEAALLDPEASDETMLDMGRQMLQRMLSTVAGRTGVDALLQDPTNRAHICPGDPYRTDPVPRDMVRHAEAVLAGTLLDPRRSHRALVTDRRLIVGVRRLSKLLWHDVPVDVRRAIAASGLSITRHVRAEAPWLVADGNLRTRVVERPNLMGLLALVPKHFRHRPDVLGRTMWLKHDGQDAAIDAGRVDDRVPPLGFDDARSWRWLTRADARVVWCWALETSRSQTVLWALARANVPADVPWLAISSILFGTPRLESLGRSDRVVCMYRLYLQHCAGLVTAERWSLTHRKLFNQMRFVEDALPQLPASVFQRGSHPTWSSLVDRAKAWHREMEVQRREAQARDVCWSSGMAPQTLGDIACTPIESGIDMLREAREMNHCVDTYIDDCQTGRYAVIRMVGTDGSRSTLGLQRAADGWVVHQHAGKDNTEPAAAHRSAAKELLERLNLLAQLPEWMRRHFRRGST